MTERVGLDRYYEDLAAGSVFHRFGLWAPARLHNGEHRLVFVKIPDGYANQTRLASEISRLLDEHPGQNIFIAGLADHRPEWMNLDYWPMGMVTPKDFHICFRYRNGLHNPDSGQALRYARGRLNRLGAEATQ